MYEPENQVGGKKEDRRIVSFGHIDTRVAVIKSKQNKLNCSMCTYFDLYTSHARSAGIEFNTFCLYLNMCLHMHAYMHAWLLEIKLTDR